MPPAPPPIAFFVELDALPAVAKRDVDAGAVPASAADACDVVRAIFFTSNAMRKERDAWLYGHADRAVIRLAGATLRYVGPDERSMLLLLGQARGLLASGPAGAPGTACWIPSTPGIDVAGGLTREEAWSACVAAHPSRSRLHIVFERAVDAGNAITRVDGDSDQAGIDGPAIAWLGPQGGANRPPAPVETYKTLRLASKHNAARPSMQVLLLNLMLDNLQGER